jgi:4-hydroxy-4-methyl-2-oxoglutarate aldolase
MKTPFSSSRPVAGDGSTGHFAPDDALSRPPIVRLDESLLAELRAIGGLAATASDVLDELGYRLAVPATTLVPRLPSAGRVVGHVLTLRYLPTRREPAYARLADEPSRLAHHSVFAQAEPGDVVVIDAGGGTVSTLGGMAAHGAKTEGVGACIVDGGVRDVDEMTALGFPVWSRLVTPITGKWRLEAASVNTPIACGGVQVRPGDLALADETGICFVPEKLAADAAARILAVHRSESEALTTPSESQRSQR